jgi:hypothetical protein
MTMEAPTGQHPLVALWTDWAYRDAKGRRVREAGHGYAT